MPEAYVPRELPEGVLIDAREGHPLDPNRGKILTADEEKRIDGQGVSIADGLLWSKSGTGMYLVVAVTSVKPKTDRRFISGAHTVVPRAICGSVRKNLNMSVGVTFGKPTFHCAAFGACLELPSDLGTDKVKRSYLAEWIADTAVEALAAAGANLKKFPTRTDAMGLWVSEAANVSINAAGL